MSNESDAKKLWNELDCVMGGSKQEIATITAFLAARDSKPPMSEEVREALEYAADPERYQKPAFYADKRLDVLASEVRRLRGEKI